MHFRLSNDHWHLSFQVMATFILPAFSLDVSSCRGPSYLCELGDELVVITCKPQETLDLSDRWWG